MADWLTSSDSCRWLANQDPTLWTHELDLRPAQVCPRAQQVEMV